MTKNIYQQVYTYYWNNLSTLPKYEYFHFISRLFLLTKDKKAEDEINKLQHTFSDLSREEVWHILDEYLTNTAPITHSETRVEYLEQYPHIRQYAREMFIVFFAKALFDKDLRDMLSPDSVWFDNFEKLKSDKPAIKHLSAFAINFLVQFSIISNQEDTLTLLSDLEHLAKEVYFPLQNSVDLELYIYFITHLIIADSLFYTRSIPESHKEYYRSLLTELEKLITKHYFSVHLDCKYEYIVCCKLCHFDTTLKPLVASESTFSLSDQGHFLVDTYNTHPQTSRRTFVTSEHRNVLFLIAYRDLHLS